MRLPKKEKKRREKIFVDKKVEGMSSTQAFKEAFPEVENYQVVRNRASQLARREDIQSQIMAELEKKVPAKWAVEILRNKVEAEGVDSIKALSLYFDLIGAKKTEHLVKSESKNLNLNIHIQGEQIQEALRKARNES